MKRALLILIMLFAGALSGCAMYNKEYYTIEDFTIPAAQQSIVESVNVKNLAQLNRAIINLVYNAATDGRIVFDTDYEGDITSDMTNACWQVRTQDAVCAYCVNSIRFELTKIVSYYEASLSISYYESAVPSDQIICQQYAIGVDSLLQKAMENNDRVLVLCINNSSLTKSAIESKVIEVFRNHPLCAVKEPSINVFTYSGSGKQRLYEINFDYGLDTAEIIRRKSQLMNLDLAENIGLDAGDDSFRRIYLICNYLLDNCALSESDSLCTLYDSLICGTANDEGMALAFYEICLQLDIECTTVYGQKSGTEHVWNIVSIGDDYYHIDLAACITDGLSEGFLLDDVAMLNRCRWNTTAYPACNGNAEQFEIELQDEQVILFETEELNNEHQ